jgi:hypothetical protein
VELYAEYLKRKGIKGCVHYGDKSSLILQSEKGNEIINISISKQHEGGNSIPYFMLTVTPNPILLATSDMLSFHFAPSGKMLEEVKMEWGTMEDQVTTIVDKYKNKYKPISSEEAMLICWRDFIKCYDIWIAHFVPHQIIKEIANTLNNEDKTSVIKSIKNFENWLYSKNSRISEGWQSLKSGFSDKSYAQWLFDIFDCKN